MTTLPAAATAYLARSRRAARVAKWVALALLIAALIAAAWFLWQSSQASAASGTLTTRVAIAQRQVNSADDEVAAAKLRSDNERAELNSNIGFNADSTTISGLSIANTTASATWETAKASASTARENVMEASLLAVIGSGIAADNAQRTLVVVVSSLAVVLIAGGIAFALSMSASKAAAMIAVANP